MEFKDFNKLLQENINLMLVGNPTLFLVDVDKDELWDTYLNSFPPGTNEIYRTRREFDCSCCRQFIKNFGNVVTIRNNKVVSFWRFTTGDKTFQTVINAMADLVEGSPVCDFLVTKEALFGTVKSYEHTKDGVRTWEHLNYQLPNSYLIKKKESVGSIAGELRTSMEMFKKSMETISIDAIETVLDLINQNSLYKGTEWEDVLKTFLSHCKEYKTIKKSNAKKNYCWATASKIGAAISRIKNHSIGVLLLDISGGEDLERAVRRYESIVAPTNYKRPKAIFTPKMVEQAKSKITELGFGDSLERRFAQMDDITANNILFMNRDVRKKLVGDVFDDLKSTSTKAPKKFDKVEEIGIEQFIEKVLPTVTNMEVLLENKHSGNMVSLIAPTNKKAKTMFKWDNAFSWAYAGNITDSIKDRVKEAGGNVTGVLRFSIQWNAETDYNQNDFDAHCIEPDGNHIYFGQSTNWKTTGQLDVDIIHPQKGQPAVENITWTNRNKMKKGVYQFYVNNYYHRGGSSGFTAEIEFDGETFQFEYPHQLKHKENIPVAEVTFDPNIGFTITKNFLDFDSSSKKIWNLSSSEFHPVQLCMYSPNYWDEQKGIGNKHYFFMLQGCINDQNPNGFFNEFLKEELMQHKKVFEALGSKMKVPDSEEQLSGLGFSSTKRNSIICRVKGSFTRTLKLLF